VSVDRYRIVICAAWSNPLADRLQRTRKYVRRLFSDVSTHELTSSDLIELKTKLIAANPIASLGTLIPFVLPAAALLAFLILTKKSRKKP